MLRSLFFFIFIYQASLQALALQVQPRDMGPFTIEVEGDESVDELKTIIEQTAGFPAAQQRLLLRGAELESETPAPVMESAAFIELTLNPEEKAPAQENFRIYENEVTASEARDITFIVTTLGNSAVPKIISKMGKLQKAGDRIDGVHPFRFLEAIFTNDATIVGIRNMKSRTVQWMWNDFTKGLFDSLQGESLKGNLDPYFEEFTAKVKIDPEFLRSFIEERNWNKVMSTLVSKVEREGNPDDFDI